MNQDNIYENRLKRLINHNPLSVAILVFVLFYGSVLLLWAYNIENNKANSQKTANELRLRIQNNFDLCLRNSYNALLTLAFTINDEGKPKDFDKIAAQVLENNRYIDALQLVPNGVITKVYPFEGNEKVIGYNILEDTSRNQEAFKAIEQKSIYFAGPFELKQGGIAVIGRLPIFRQDTFWGFSACIIHLNTLLESAQLLDIDTNQYYVQLSKKNPSTGTLEYFLPKRNLDYEKLEAPIIFPQGDWLLHIETMPTLSHKLFSWALLIVGFIFSFVAAFLTNRILSASRNAISKLYGQLSGHLENSPLGIIEYDNELNITKWNERCRQIFGWTEEEILTSKYNAYSIIYKDDLEKTKQVAEELLSGLVDGNTSRNKNYTKDGKVIDCLWYNSVIRNSKGEVTSFMSLVQDVTHETLINKERSVIYDRLNIIFNATNDWMALLKVNADLSFSYELVNQKFIFTLGLDSENVIGQTIGYANKDVGEIFQSRCVEVVESKRGINFEFSSVAKGNPFVFDITISPIFNNADECSKLIVVGRDLTSKRNTETELKRTLNLTKRQNDRLINFSYIISHNLRSHTSNISGIVDMLLQERNAEADDMLLNYLKRISIKLNKTMYHLNEVVNIQSKKDVTLSQLNLANEIDEVIDLLATKILAKKAIVENNVDRELVICFNRPYLESVLHNFIDNAVKYSATDRSPLVKLSTHQKDNYTVLEIEDNGIGIDLEKHKESLFGMYKRFNLEQEGTGIGLFLAKSQIETYGGKIEVESTINKGTKFKVFFNNKVDV